MIDIFRIGVHIGMTSNSPEMLGVMLRDLAKVEGAVGALKKNFDSLKTVAIGAIAVVAGAEALKGIWSMVDASKELNKNLESIKLLGGNSSNQNTNYFGRIDEIRKRAFATSAIVPQITPAENVKIIGEASTQFGIDTAEELSVKLAQMEALLKRSGKGGNLMEGLKALDQIGGFMSKDAKGHEVFDAKLLGDLLDKMQRGIAASGGMLGPADYLAYAKQAGLSAKQMDSDVIFGYITEALIAMGSSRAGTAEGSLHQQIIGGTMTEKVAEELKKHGLLKEYRVGRGGHIIPNSASVTGKDEFERNPFGWVNDVVVPQLQKEGMNPRQILEEISHLFGRATTQRLVGEMINNKAQFERTNKVFQQSFGIGASKAELDSKDLTTNLNGLQGAWTGLMQAVGEAGVPTAIKLIQDLTHAIVSLEQAAAMHPDFTRYLIEFSAGFSALLATGGALTIASVALSPFTSALKLLGAAATTATGGAATATAAGAGVLGLVAGLSALAGFAAGFIGWIGANINDPKVWNRKQGYVDGRDHRDNEHSMLGGWFDKKSVAPPGHWDRKHGFTADNPAHVVIDNHAQVGASAASGTVRGITNSLAGPRATGPVPDIRAGAYGNAYP